MGGVVEGLVDREEFILHEKERGDCYRLLAACFYVPNKELFLREELFINFKELVGRVCPDAAVHCAAMEEAFARSSDEELSVDYAKLFVGPFELKAPPYGSVYLDNMRAVMGDSTVETVNVYREEGLSINGEFRELPDHIAVELEFMYYLTVKEVGALSQPDTSTALHYVMKQGTFLRNFLGKWAPQFCEKIKEGTESDFYRALAGCVSVFIEKAFDEENIVKAVPVLWKS